MSQEKKRKPQRPEPEPAEKMGDEEEEAPAWLRKAAERHEQRQQKYAAIFDGAKDAVQKDKEKLSGLLQSKAFQSEETEPEEAAPDIFGAAAREYQERQKSLGGIFGDAMKAKQQEKEALSKMFGDRPKKGPRR